MKNSIKQPSMFTGIVVRMHTPFTPPSSPSHSSRSGSVLLLTLLVVSLLLVIVVTFTVYVRMGLREIGDRQELHLAQSNAKVGMQLALGSLQQYAGHDQRVTGDAQLVGSNQQPHWTGVWPADDASSLGTGVNAGDPVWLVSGNGRPQPNMAIPNNEQVRIYPDEAGVSDAEEVIVQAQELPLGDKTGRYAWWVGDEGIKARVDISADALAPPATTVERSIRSQSPLEPGMTFLNESWIDPIFWSDPNQPQKINSLDSLHFADNSLKLSAIRHHLTTYSYGLPVNVKDGGLKADWSVVLDRSMTNTPLVDHYLGAPKVTAFTKNGVPVYKFPGSSIDDEERFFLSDGIGSQVPGNIDRPGPNLGILWQYGRLWQMVSNQTMDLPVPPAPFVTTDVRRKAWAPYDTHDGGFEFSDDHQHQNSTVAPVLSHLRFGLRLKTEPDDIDPTQFKLLVEVKPTIGMWNPYNITIAENTYMIDWAFSPFIKIRITDPITSTSVEHTAWLRDQWALDAAPEHGPTQDGERWFRLWIEDQDFQPGEVRLFSIRNQTEMSGSHITRNTILTPNWNTNGAIVVPFESSGSPLTGIPSTSIIEVLEVGMQDTYFEDTHNEVGRSISDDFSMTWVSLKWEDSDPISRMTGLWNSGPVDADPSSTASYTNNLIPEAIYDGSTLYGQMTPASLNGNPVALASWAFHLRTTKASTDNNQRIRGLVDSNFRAPVSNSDWETDDSFDHQEGWKYSSTWTGEGNDNRGLAFNEEPEATPSGRYNGFLGASVGLGDGNTHVPIFDVPLSPLVSVGQFQHAQLSRYDFEPSFVAGNSYASVRIPLDETVATNYNGKGFDLYDISYDVNNRIWDEIFFSTLAPDYVNAPGWGANLESYLNSLPNPRMVYFDGNDDLSIQELVSSTGTSNERGAEALAARIRILGAFNVNSTSKTAWKALLSSMANSELPVVDPATGSLSWESPNGIRFNKFSHVIEETPFESGDSNNDPYWRGWRKLSESELDRLAQSIVDEVKARGPFRSMGDFVNRDPDSGIITQQRKGALQTALDETVNRTGNDIGSALGDSVSSPNGSQFSNAFDGESTSTGYAGYLMQGDLLQSLAPILQVRSDTFVVRSFGETSNGTSAWCEAVVQRVPDYLDDSNASWENAQDDTLADVNRIMGRQFEIVSFRWLNSDESGEAL
ncbi:hypothetical protein P3T73_03560 [Kiritimatiellota bacterium B12222]|nr:hypothetical protein P3T73_03560 [Kiritimatiellota bacterium B12222]